MKTVLYHNHVPRTSGTDILYELQRATKFSNGKATLYTPGILEFHYDKEKTKNFDVITGHFASNPIRENSNLITFSIVRSPFDQYISTAAYRFLTDGVEMTSNDLDRFIDGEFDIFGEFQGFSGCENPQSKFLAAKLVHMVDEELGRDMYHFVDNPQSLSDVRSFIDDSIIGTLENRNLVIEKVNEVLLQKFNIKIKANTNRTNTTVPLKFTVSSAQRKKIVEKLELDEQVYQYVKTIEKRQYARL
jgi:hypothetical protein